jgi:hypothetical protein
MLDPFDQSSLQGIYSGNRFSGGQADEDAAAAGMVEDSMVGAIDINTAKRSGKLRVKAAKRASKYRDKQMEKQMEFQREMARDARRAARPSTGQRIAGGIGTAASAIGAVSGAVGLAAAI